MSSALVPALLALPLAIPLLAGAVLVLLPARLRWTSRVLAMVATGMVLAVGVVLVATTRDGGAVGQRVGDWPAGIAIMLAADQFSALLVTVTAVLVLGGLLFAFATGDDARRMFTPLVLVLSAGVYGAYLTGDLFNLFVFIEVMLVPSYVLVVLSGARRRLSAGGVYLTVSLLTSTMFLAGLGLIYGLAGTVNLGELAGAASRSDALAVATGVLLVAMGIKAAVVPVHTWLPRVYREVTPAVVVLFSGLLTKVGVYVIFRLYAVMYDGDPRWRWLLLTVALVTLLVGAATSLGDRSIRGVLLYSMVSHIGFMLVGVGLFTEAGLTAGVFYLLQYVLVKASLLMCAGAVQTTYGTDRLDRLGGLVSREPLLATTFMVGALSLIGIPPLAGFVGKLALARGAFGDGQWWTGGLVVAGSLLTLLAMVHVWNQAFWGHDGELTWAEVEEGGTVSVTKIRRTLLAPAVGLASGGLVLGVAAQPVLALAGVAAGNLLDPAGYVTAVMPR